MWWPKTERQRELVALAAGLAEQFSAGAEAHDREGSFPHENFASLHRSGYLALTIPQEFGGRGATILEATLAQERLARGDGSTALGTSMHLSILGRLGRAVLAGDAAEMGGWDRERLRTCGTRRDRRWRATQLGRVRAGVRQSEPRRTPFHLRGH